MPGAGFRRATAASTPAALPLLRPRQTAALPAKLTDAALHAPARIPGQVSQQHPGVLDMMVTADPQQRAVLLISYNDYGIVRMLGLPDLADRGCLPGVSDARAMSVVPGSIIITGDKLGKVKVFQWKPAAPAGQALPG
jgi:hypothetical protein